MPTVSCFSVSELLYGAKSLSSRPSGWAVLLHTRTNHGNAENGIPFSPATNKQDFPASNLFQDSHENHRPDFINESHFTISVSH